MRKDLRESPEYAAVAEHVRRLHEPVFGRPHHVTDLVTTTDASRIIVTGSVYDQLEGLPRTALYEVRGGALHALTSGGGSPKAGRDNGKEQRLARHRPAARQRAGQYSSPRRIRPSGHEPMAYVR